MMKTIKAARKRRKKPRNVMNNSLLKSQSFVKDFAFVDDTSKKMQFFH